MRVETVAESFATYRAGVMPVAASEVQVEECQRAFYAGAFFMLMNLLCNVGDGQMTEDEGTLQIAKLEAELIAFAKAVEMPLPVAVPPERTRSH